MIFRKRFALALTRLISGDSRIITGLTALCLTGIVLFAGVYMAEAARGLRRQLAGSEILNQLFGEQTERERLEPHRAVSFLSYLNALAPAVLNMELEPDQQFGGFDVLYEAARENEVTMRSFRFDESGNRISVSCTAKNSLSAIQFYKVVQECSQFEAVDFSQENKDTEDFTITCVYFKSI